MKKTKYKEKGGYFSFIMNSIDGKATFSPLKNKYIFPAIICLIVWIFISSFALRDVYERVAHFQNLVTKWNESAELLKSFKQSEGSSWIWSKKEEEKISPFMQVTIANISAFLVLIIFLKGMCYFAKSKASWRETFIFSGTISFPLSVGMFVSIILFKIADSIAGESNIPGILYGIASLIMITLIITAFIIFYVDIAVVLGIKERKQYWTTIFGLYIFVGVFSMVSHWLIRL